MVYKSVLRHMFPPFCSGSSIIFDVMITIIITILFMKHYLMINLLLCDTEFGFGGLVVSVLGLSGVKGFPC